MKLDIPKLKRPGASSFKMNPELVQNWIQELPLANTNVTSKQLGMALAEVNGVMVPVGHRQQILDYLSSPVQCTVQSLMKSALGTTNPHGKKQLDNTARAFELSRDMSIGYKILAANSNDNNDWQLMAEAIHCAIRFLSEALLINYQVYIQYPKNIWKDIHQLYMLAEESDITRQTVRQKPQERIRIANTIESAYKQILLLSLACPYKHRKNSILAIYNALADWAGHSRIFMPDEDNHAAFFAVRLTGDAPPVYLALDEMEKYNHEWRLLNTKGMSEHIRAAQNNAGTGEGLLLPPALDKVTLQRIMLSWGVIPVRRFSRHQENITTRLSIGINTIHNVIAGPATLNQATVDDDENIDDNHYLRDPTFELTTCLDINPETGLKTGRTAHHVREIGQKPDAWRDNLSGSYSAPAKNSSRTRSTTNIESWKMQNISAGGYCFLWDTAKPSNTQVGEVVAMDAHNNDHWQLGVIRWMKFSREYGLELGIQTLSPDATAVWVSLAEDNHTDEQNRGLVLPEIKQLSQPESILLPTLPFQTGSVLIIERAGNKEKVRLTQLLESTGCFSQYLFSPV